MKKYRLKKDLPTFKAGEKFEIDGDGCLRSLEQQKEYRAIGQCIGVMAYSKSDLEKFPDILTDWFEEIPEEPKTVWRLKEGDTYYYVFDETKIRFARWDSCRIDNERRDTGNCFLTKEEVEKEIAWRKARQVLLQDTKGFKPDWNNEGQCKCTVYYDNDDKKLHWVNWGVNILNEIIFNDSADAEKSILEHKKEWLTYLGVEERI